MQTARLRASLPLFRRTVMTEVNNKRDLDAQLRKNQTVLVLFYASWCPYCQSFLKFFGKVVSDCSVTAVIRVNLDEYNNPLWEHYSIEAVPTVIFFNGGKVCSRLDGKLGEGLSEKQLKIWLSKLG
jgi:thioredoxin 1